MIQVNNNYLLQNLANNNYKDEVNKLIKRKEPQSINNKGSLIDKKYETSLTPLQQNQAWAIAILALGVLGIVATGSLQPFGLSPGLAALSYIVSSLVMIGGGFFWYAMKRELDLDSPKVQDSIRTHIQNKTWSLYELRANLQDPEKVIKYALLPQNADTELYTSVNELFIRYKKLMDTESSKRAEVLRTYAIARFQGTDSDNSLQSLLELKNQAIEHIEQAFKDGKDHLEDDWTNLRFNARNDNDASPTPLAAEG